MKTFFKVFFLLHVISQCERKKPRTIGFGELFIKKNTFRLSIIEWVGPTPRTHNGLSLSNERKKVLQQDQIKKNKIW